MKFSVKIWAASILVAVSLVAINDLFFFESVFVPSSSMEPTLLPTEHLFVEKATYKTVRRFDVVVIDDRNIGHRIVKRVVGLPGECIRLVDSAFVEVNGQLLDYKPGGLMGDQFVTEGSTHTVQLRFDPRKYFLTQFGESQLCLGVDEFYALGDNRFASKDSRVHGPFKREQLVGRARLVWLSVAKQQRKLRRDRLFTWVR